MYIMTNKYLVRGTSFVIRYNVQFLQIKELYLVPVRNSCACAKTRNRTALMQLIIANYVHDRRNNLCHEVKSPIPSNKEVSYSTGDE